MGATSSVVTHKLDLRKKDLSYDTFEQHMAIVGDKSLARLRELRLCRNKLSALPPRLSLFRSEAAGSGFPLTFNHGLSLAFEKLCDSVGKPVIPLWVSQSHKGMHVLTRRNLIGDNTK